MALDKRYTQQTFVEIYSKDEPTDVTRRENAERMNAEQRAEEGRYFASRIDRNLYGVRLARYTVETLEEF